MNNFKGTEAEFKGDVARICLVPLKTVINDLRFKPALNWNGILVDLRRGLNSLNSDIILSDPLVKENQLNCLQIPSCYF